MSEDLSLSEELRRAREARGESLEQVHQRTGIAPGILHGLEAGDLQVVEAVYTRLAIVHYASYLGLDGDALAQRFERESGADAPAPVPVRTEATATVSVPLSTPLADRIRTFPRGPLTAAVVVLLALLAVAWYLLGGGGDEGADDDVGAGLAPARQTQAPVSAAVPVADVADRRRAEPTAIEAPAAAVASAPPASASTPAADSTDASSDIPEMVTSSDTGAVAVEPSDSVDVRVSDLVSPAVSPVWPATPDSLPVTGVGALRLQADALDSTWVQVQWDGVDGFEEIIPQGERRTWAADRYFMVRAGRAHGVHFHFQGQLLGEGRLGDPTKVLRFRASADGVQLLGPDLEPIAPIAQVQPDTMESSPPGVR